MTTPTPFFFIVKTVGLKNWRSEAFPQLLVALQNSKSKPEIFVNVKLFALPLFWEGKKMMKRGFFFSMEVKNSMLLF